ncbi:MAG TPA: substrate-binding domain-containing protein [Xanthobacteraceae bacterium]|nr:substrate-binding domain-containing protein [Xanthobacteraceae bacterium]
MRIIVSKICIAALALAASAGIATAAEVKLISVGGVKLGLDPIIADFMKQTGNKVTYTATSPAMVTQKLAAGEAFDVVVQSAPAMAELAKASGIKPETRTAVVRGGIGMAVNANAPAPDISTADAFKKTLIAAKSIGVGDPAVPNGSGVVIQRILDKSGIMDQIKPKLKVVGLDPGQEMIQKGELELGLMNAAEVRTFVKFAGPVPAPLQDYTSYEAAVTAKAAAPDAARALVEFMASKAAAQDWRMARMEPNVQ